MKVQGTYTFEAPLETVWNALFDAEVLARTLPGCDKLEREGNQFKGDINVKMGPVQGKFQGKVDIIDVKERESYTMIVDGRGPAGFGKATALMRVQSEGTGTRLDYDSDVTVGGKIASVGQRLIDASSRAIVKQSLEGLHQQIKALAGQPQVAPGARGAVPSAAVLSGAVPSGAVPSGAVPSAPVPSPSVPIAAITPGVSLPEPDRAAPAAALESALAAAAPGALGGSAPAPVTDAVTAGIGSPPAAPARASPEAAWFGATGSRSGGSAPEARPATPLPLPRPPAGPSQAGFVFGVAKEVAKDLLPIRTVLFVVGLLVLGWVIFRSVRGGG